MKILHKFVNRDPAKMEVRKELCELRILRKEPSCDLTASHLDRSWERVDSVSEAVQLA